MKERLLRTWTNIRSRGAERPLLLIESDDWGAIRMPGRSQFEVLERSGIDVHTNPYDQLDCLENKDDLEALFNVLASYKNSSGQSPRFTFNTILGNPDFQAIREAEFQEFFRKDLFESYLLAYGEDLRPVWEQAMNERLIRPQFHGREHLNVGLWLSDLRAGHTETRTAFSQNYYGHRTSTSAANQKNYLAAFWPQSSGHLVEIEGIIKDGLDLFEKFFGYRSKSFIPCNYILPEALEAVTAELGVELIQGQRGQLLPSSDGSIVGMRRNFTGERNAYGQFYSVRNVRFEPFEAPSRDWVATAMREIKAAFFWRSPAIVSTHRANYVGSMSVRHRDQNLRLLSTLLENVLKRWPDVEFACTDELIPMLDG